MPKFPPLPFKTTAMCPFGTESATAPPPQLKKIKQIQPLAKQHKIILGNIRASQRHKNVMH